MNTEPGQDDLLRPMNDEDRIKLLRLEAPLCGCGRPWVPYRFGKIGFVRQCPTCVFTASFCICALIGEDNPGPMPGFAF